MLTVLLILLLSACLPSSCSLAAQGFFFPFILILSTTLIQELTSTYFQSFIPFTVKSETPYLLLYFHLPAT
ncbi:hypothetical protein E2C01_053367 [Portunus trituberculatus]|uniref:Secreted protein n=1 Tax=Portunus trituberculatus TaxID=210409 RepID=A0A5B7GQK7_PORTR|nr:hypothetical protein [Portunus trituberculatus]